MLMRRLLALALAVGLVVGAWQLRERVLDGGGAGADAAPEDLRIACVRELEQVCQALDVPTPPLVEEATTTVAGFSEPQLPFDVWLTIEPWPALAANARARAGQGEVPQHVSAVLA